MKDLAKKILDNLLEQEIARPYSGKFMYGQECLAIFQDDSGDTDHPLALVVEEAVELLNEGEDPYDILEALKYLCSTFVVDELGRGVVVYWPRIRLERSDNDED